MSSFVVDMLLTKFKKYPSNPYNNNVIMIIIIIMFIYIVCYNYLKRIVKNEHEVYSYR